MKWSELNYSSDFYIPFDENQRAIRGYWLTTLGVDLNSIPEIFREPFCYFDSYRTRGDTLINQKVLLSEIVGTSHTDYGGMPIIESFMRAKRAHHYISDGCVTRYKFFRMLKKPVSEQEVPIILSRSDNDSYYIDCSGNHRIILYKIMMLAEIMKTYSFIGVGDYIYSDYKEINKKYWINAKVRSPQ